MIIIHHIRPVNIQISLGIRQMGQEPLLPTRKSLTPRVSNETKSMTLIIYCRGNAHADLSHRYMQIKQCPFCVVVVTS